MTQDNKEQEKAIMGLNEKYIDARMSGAIAMLVAYAFVFIKVCCDVRAINTTNKPDHYSQWQIETMPPDAWHGGGRQLQRYRWIESGNRWDDGSWQKRDYKSAQLKL